MKSKNSGATIYYIDPSSLSIKSVVVMKYELRRGTTYLSEAFWKMPDNVEHYEVILFESDNAAAIDRLKKLAEKLPSKAAL